MRVAILVDGGYYRKRANAVLGSKVSPKDRAKELHSYCLKHLKEEINGEDHFDDLYRIFYYDCPPAEKKIYHPLQKTDIDLSKSNVFSWTNEFLKELSKKRKVALRLGSLLETQAHYNLKKNVIKDLMERKITLDDLKEKDFELNIDQKGVDMKIGLDIASLAYKKQVDKIILIAGDSDFVPASKLARREGIDFVLDSLGAPIKAELSLHIDGLRHCDDRFSTKKNH